MIGLCLDLGMLLRICKGTGKLCAPHFKHIYARTMHILYLTLSLQTSWSNHKRVSQGFATSAKQMIGIAGNLQPLEIRPQPKPVPVQTLPYTVGMRYVGMHIKYTDGEMHDFVLTPVWWISHDQSGAAIYLVRFSPPFLIHQLIPFSLPRG